MGQTYNTTINIILQAINKATKPLDEVKKKMEGLRAIQGRLLSGGLAFLFTGMALQRFFGGFLRSAFNTYVQIIDVQDQFFQKTQHLRAAWEFLKFAIVDALGNSELFIFLIDAAIQLINWIGQLGPETLKAIGTLALLGFIGATAFVVLGTGILFVMGMMGFFGKTLGLVLKNFSYLAIAIAAITALFVLWGNKSATMEEKIVGSLFIITLAAIGVALVIKAWPVALALALVAMVIFFVLFRERIWNSLKILLNSIKMGWIDMKEEWANAWYDMRDAAAFVLEYILKFINLFLPKQFEISVDPIIEGMKQATLVARQISTFGFGEERKRLRGELFDLEKERAGFETVGGKLTRIFLGGPSKPIEEEETKEAEEQKKKKPAVEKTADQRNWDTLISKVDGLNEEMKSQKEQAKAAAEENKKVNEGQLEELRRWKEHSPYSVTT